ncbi:MAG: hypothetical protein A3E87_08150 [Gammaproteobacteria bacterium RIFCSPHIGHO2_12_FULL_35_23]|nr:MAG: hypothetical protein A3E87_08150 [Gammaproteobacteria bacterium RIFCSPHIGHO2_12_FULL_35_23]
MKLIIKIILVSLLISLTNLGFTYNLPKLGIPGNSGLTITEENELGLRFIQAIKTQLPLVSDPIIVDYVQTLGNRLVAHSDSPRRTFYFFVVNDVAINAFAGPGGYICVNTGLILVARSEAELAAVMAHEIAHVTQRHIARAIESLKRVQVANIAATLAAAAVASSNPQAAAGLATAANAGSTQAMINFTRSHEEEADRVGMQTLANSGYQPISMANFFARLQKQTQLNDTDEIPEILRTHPLTSNRLAEAESRSSLYKVKNPRPNNPEFYLIQARILALTSNNALGLIRNLQTSVAKNPSEATLYAYTLALTKANQLQKASSVVQTLLSKDPSEPLFMMAKASILAAERQSSQALGILATAYQANPNYLPLIIQYADLLIINNQANTAMKLLNKVQARFENNELYLSLLAQAQGRAGQLAKAYQTRAKIYLLNNNPDGAIIQLQQALSYAKDRYTKAQIQFQLARIKQDQALDKRLNSGF